MTTPGGLADSEIGSAPKLSASLLIGDSLECTSAYLSADQAAADSVLNRTVRLSEPAFVLSPDSLINRTVGLSAFEALRVAAGFSRAAVARAAGVSVSWYCEIASTPDRATVAFVKRLRAGLARLKQEVARELSDDLLLATYGGFLAAISPFYGVTPCQVRATSAQAGATADKHWRACAHARQAALYLTNTALGVGQKRLALALGLTPAAVCLALRSVEDRRDDASFDAALSAAQLAVTGRSE